MPVSVSIFQNSGGQWNSENVWEGEKAVRRDKPRWRQWRILSTLPGWLYPNSSGPGSSEGSGRWRELCSDRWDRWGVGGTYVKENWMKEGSVCAAWLTMTMTSVTMVRKHWKKAEKNGEKWDEEGRREAFCQATITLLLYLLFYSLYSLDSNGQKAWHGKICQRKL